MAEPGSTDLGALRHIMNLLADGQFRSGEELGLALGVSRAAVWKHLQKLEGLGVQLLSIKGRGYCIDGGLDLLDVAKITQYLNSSLPLNINLFPQIDSTNSYLMRLEDPALHVCLAESQSAGRGRRGRVWISPFAQNIYCSIGWGFEGGVAALEGLSLAAGLAVARALQRHGLSEVKLKWPNDVLYRHQKLGGVLIEVVGDPAGYCRVVVGVGLNVAMNDDQSAAITQPWTDIRRIERSQGRPPIARNVLVSELIDQLVLILDGYEKQGFSNYCDEWQSLNAHAGQLVELQNGNSSLSGVCLGVSAAGALMLQTERGRELFHGGEISMRPVNDS